MNGYELLAKAIISPLTKDNFRRMMMRRVDEIKAIDQDRKKFIKEARNNGWISNKFAAKYIKELT